MAILKWRTKIKPSGKNGLNSCLKQLKSDTCPGKNCGNQFFRRRERRTEIASRTTDPKFGHRMNLSVGSGSDCSRDIQSIIADLRRKNIGITDHRSTQRTGNFIHYWQSIPLWRFYSKNQGRLEDLANDEKVRKVYLGSTLSWKEKTIKFEKRKFSFCWNLWSFEISAHKMLPP